MKMWWRRSEKKSGREKRDSEGEGETRKRIERTKKGNVSVLLRANTERWVRRRSAEPHVLRQGGDINTHTLTAHWEPVSCSEQNKKKMEGDPAGGEKPAQTKLYYSSKTTRDLYSGLARVLKVVPLFFPNITTFGVHCRRFWAHTHTHTQHT